MTNNLTQEEWTELVKRAWERVELEELCKDDNKFVYILDGAIVKRGDRWEYDVGKLLFENGVNVPEQYAFASWRHGANKEWEGHEERYIVMQLIMGRHLAGIDGKIRDFPEIRSTELATKLREELMKVIRLGIVPKDGDWYDNSLFVPEEERLYLIDFGRYYEGSKEQLETFERRISRIENFLRTRPEF